ncbi:MAG: fibronectin type III domain-containing protein [Isosphaeraceae bacterium]|nr:fibronectin type III domain-containing protein [Isosphaeraceae bacterium]
MALSWTDAPGEAGFRIERSSNGGSTWAVAGTVASGVTTFTDTGLAEATSYTYRIFATNGSGDSIPSATQAAVTPPGAPTSLAAVVASGGQINLTWTDHSSAAAYYVIQQSPNGSTGWVQVGTVNGAAANSDTATGPFAGSTTYYFRVYAYAYTGSGSAYATTSATTPALPGRPTLNSATAQSDTTAALAWTDVAGETGFLVERSTNSGSTWTTAGTVAAGVTTFIDAGLVESTSYTYRVTATNAAGASAASATRSVATLPSAPTGLTAAVVSGGQVNLTWTDHSSAASYYVIQQSPNGSTGWVQVGTTSSGSVSSSTATGPFNGSTTYYFRVYAYSSAGGGSAYATASASTPAFPNQPVLASATAQSDTSIALSWTDVAGETGFVVERSTNNGTSWTTAGTVGAGVTSFTDTGLSEATSYSYRVTATNGAGSSAPSATRSVATEPSAATGLTASAISPTQINLSWTDHSAAAYYYYVEQSTNGTTWTQLAALSGSGTSSYTATGPFNGSTTYDFRVHAYANTGGNSAYATASVTTPAFPSQPAITTAMAQSDTVITLAWGDVAGESGFLIERSTNNGSTWTTAGTVGTGMTTFTDTGLSESTPYTYRVTATNPAGSSAPSATRSVATQPSAPSGLTATAVSATQVNLTWTNHSSAATYDYVEQSTNGTTWTQVGSVYGTTATSYTATGPFNGSTTYDFRVHAYANTGGNSAYATASVTMPAFPSQPAITTAMAQSDTVITLAWGDVAGESGFLIERSTNNGSTWTTAGTVGTGMTTFTDTGLSESTSYTYRVTATNPTGSSAPSTTQAATTLPAAPTGLSAVVVSGGQINLSWTNHSTAASYYIVQQSPNGSTGWVQIANAGGNACTVTGSFSSSTTYYFRVAAYAFTGGTSAYVSTSTTTPAFPGQPTLISVTAQSNTSVLLTWSDVAGETGFRVDRSSDGGTTWTTAGTVGTSITSFTDTGLTEATSYAYRVTATNAAASSAPSATRSVATQPSAPSGLAATAISPAQINLSWTDHSTAASYYYVEQSTDGTTWTQVGYVYGTTATSYTATGPFNGSTTYDFRVRAYSSGGYSAYSPVTSVTTAGYPSQPVLTSAAAPSDTSVTLTWTDAAGEAGFRVERYVASSGTWTAIGLVPAGVTTYTDAGLREGSSFTYRVVATNAVGDSAPSASLAATTLTAAPTGLSANAVAWNRIDLSWTNHSSLATTYYVEQSADSTHWTQIGSISDPGAISFSAIGPFNGSTMYYFRVRAYSSTGGYSTYSSVTATTPAFPNPPALTGTPQSDTSVTLTWTDAAGGSGFRVERLVGGTWTAVGTVGTGVTSFTDTGLSEATSYSYRLFATNSVGDSAPSATQTAATPPSSPSGLTATAISPTRVNLSWTDHSTAASSYYVEQSTDGISWTQVASLSGSGASSYTATGPFNGSTTYYFRVHAYAYTGGNSAYATATVTTPGYPSQPTIGAAAAQSDTVVTLTWSDVAGETGFRIERLVSGTWTAVGTVAAGVTSFTDTGLSEATSYSYRLFATNSVGDSAPSATQTVATILDAPEGLTATFVSGSEIDLSWTDRSSVATGYAVEQSTDGMTWTQVGSLGATATSFTATGPFDPATSYEFRVRAYDNAGHTSYSPTAVVIAPSLPFPPTGVTAVPTSDTAITVTWTEAAGEDGYVIERSSDGWSDWAQIGTAAANQTSFTDTGLTEGASRYYRVRSTMTAFAAESSASSLSLATTLPARPTGLEVTAIDGGLVQLHWQDNSAIASGYSIRELIDGTYQEIQAVGAGVTDATVAAEFDPSTSYSFEVLAFETPLHIDTEYSLASNVAQVTTGAWAVVPSNLIASGVSETEIDLSWSDNAGAGADYEVDRSADGGSTWMEIATVPSGSGGTAEYADTGLTGGEFASYAYRVRATEAGVGDSAYSDIAEAVTLPATPTDFSATIPDGGQVNLTWVDQSNIETAYIVQQLVDGDWQDVGQADANAQAMTVIGTYEPATQYTFRVMAYTYTTSRDAYSAPSNEATATTPAWPLAPTDLTTTAVSNSEIDLAWTANATDATSYEIDRSTDGVTWTVVTDSLPPDTQSYADVGLSDGTMYDYQVRAVNGIGGSGYASGAAATLPTAPTNLQATVVSGTEIDLSWTASDYATGYTIWKLPEGSESWELVDDAVPATQTAYAVTGLMPGGTYYAFAVAPTNSTADSAVANIDPPTLNTSPVIDRTSAAPDPVTGKSATLSVAAGDDQPESQLTYSWSLLSSPDDTRVTFSDNNTNSAKSTLVAFDKAGTYLFLVIVTDAQGLSDTETLSVSVNQQLTGIVVTPEDAAVMTGQTRQLTATAVDQFGDAMDPQPGPFTWSLGGGGVGAVDASGLYTAPSSGTDATFTVSASAGGESGTANLAFRAKPVAADWQYDEASSEGTPSTGSPHDFDLAAPAELSLRDAFIAGDIYQAYDNGTLILTTAFDGSSPYSHGEVRLAAGHHSLKFVDTTSPLYPAGFYYKVDPLPDMLLELTVADHGAPTTNKVTAITDQAIKDLYVSEDRSTMSADVDVSALFDPNTNKFGKEIHFTITRADGLIVDNSDFGNGAAEEDVALPVIATARDFVITVWWDVDGDGLLDNGEDKREVDVHIIGFNSDNNGDGVVNATDDGLNATQPTALNLEGNGPQSRTEFDISIGAPGGDVGGYKLVLPNVAGLEFWTAATGGSQLMPDADGNIIDADLTSGYTRTIWVSAASATLLSAAENAPGGPTGDATIQLQVNNRVGKTVAQTSIGVNRPVEVLYAVDGTSATAAKNYNVRQFEQRFRGVEGTDKFYFAGPVDEINGSDSPAIVTDVEWEIALDYQIATLLHRRLVIDMVGWSRGAVIVGTVAADLNTVTLTGTSFVIPQALNTATQSIPVHWLGLFDAVSQMGVFTVPSGPVVAPHSPWAKVFSPNVVSRFHLIHTYVSTKQNNLFPTEMGFAPTTPFNLPGGSTHGAVGTNPAALNMMINNARAAGVPVR